MGYTNVSICEVSLSANAAKAEPVPAVIAQVDRVDNATARLADAIAVLEDRLRPVLGQYGSGSEGSEGVELKRSSAPLAGSLEGLADRLERHIGEIRDLVDRLEI